MMVMKSVPIRYNRVDPCSIRFAVGLNPSAMQDEARPRELARRRAEALG